MQPARIVRALNFASTWAQVSLCVIFFKSNGTLQAVGQSQQAGQPLQAYSNVVVAAARQRHCTPLAAMAAPRAAAATAAAAARASTVPAAAATAAGGGLSGPTAYAEGTGQQQADSAVHRYPGCCWYLYSKPWFLLIRCFICQCLPLRLCANTFTGLQQTPATKQGITTRLISQRKEGLSHTRACCLWRAVSCACTCPAAAGCTPPSMPGT